MDTLEGQKSRVRNALSSELDNLERLLTEQLAQKLAECDAAFAAENQKHVQEIGILQFKAARAGDLEAENVRLRAELEAAKGRHTQLEANAGKDAEQARDSNARAASTISAEEHNRVKDELAKYERDYRKIVFAHSVLKTRVQYYKGMMREWRVYDKDWILGHPKRQAKFFPEDIAKPTGSIPAHDERLSNASSAPSPPAYPADFRSCASGDSRSTSPQEQNPIAENSSPGQRFDAASGYRGKPKALTDQIIATQAAIDHGHDADLEDLTQSDESEEHPSTAIPPSTPRSKTLARDNGAKALPADSGSSPIVVFARCLKRKRFTNECKASVRVHEDFQKSPHASKSRSVKDEVSSSSPLLFAQSLHLRDLQDSLDLDDVGDQLTTPRKRQRLESSMLAPPLTPDKQDMLLDDMSEAEHGESGSPLVKDEESRHFSHANVNPCEQLAGKASQDNNEQQLKLRNVEKRAYIGAHNDRVIERQETAKQSPNGSKLSMPEDQIPATGGAHRLCTPQGGGDTEQIRAEFATPIILRLTDHNTRILPRTSKGPVKRQNPPDLRDRGAAAVPALAEDGEDFSSSDTHTDPITAKKASKIPDIHHRLGALLSEPFAAKGLSPLPLSRTPGGVRGQTASRTPLERTYYYTGLKALTTPSKVPAKTPGPLESALDGNKALNEGSKSARAAPRVPAAKPMFRKPPNFDEPLEARPEHEPLRARPMHRLRLEDFKLNPAHSGYAYHESVRKHDEKKTISGCTDKNCPRCKEIRKFVENSGYANLAGQNREDIDQRLMEDFVGGDRRRLSRMSAEEEKEILTKAQMQQFADQFGKHKQRFDRAQSPVGFWDVEFPSTQEDEQNRKAVEIRKREKVKERYWEAVREGGRYVFADE
ncbi:hypothetical protein N7G274_010612 [Stereocaulon virgatum]|uniref:DNA endonuclease activator Ctp1 C-terminal domain-containing protein n=1 Tax=Stereocaulon virgatum TaxID=373712 RepID=A0ABR3ZX77_9LECA